MPFVVTAEGISKESVKEVGGKAANLAEMMNNRFPVPEAFFITIEAFNKFIDENKMRPRITEIIDKTDFSNVESLAETSQKVKHVIMSGKMPDKVRDGLLKAYEHLSYMKDNSVIRALDFLKANRQLPFVAVRSSSALEDVSKTSAAGQYETFLNVRANESLMLHVMKCWASFYTPRAIYYRHKHSQPQDAGMGVIVQRMINSSKSGVSFTVDPTDPTEEGANHILPWIRPEASEPRRHLPNGVRLLRSVLSREPRRSAGQAQLPHARRQAIAHGLRSDRGQEVSGGCLGHRTKFGSGACQVRVSLCVV